MTSEELVAKVARDFYERTGYEIKLPSECSLDDEERGRYVAIVAAIRIALEAAKDECESRQKEWDDAIARHAGKDNEDWRFYAGGCSREAYHCAMTIRALIPEEQ